MSHIWTNLIHFDGILLSFHQKPCAWSLPWSLAYHFTTALLMFLIALLLFVSFTNQALMVSNVQKLKAF